MPHVELPVKLSSTRAELGERCHRRHVLSDILEYGKCRSPSAAFGTVMHAASATWWEATQGGKALPLAMKMAADAITDSYPKEMAGACSIGDHTLQMAEGMLDVYTAQAELVGPWTSAGSWKDMLIEQRLVIDVGEHKLSFQQDRSAYNEQLDWLVVMDLKTAGRFSSQWRNQWSHSLQMKLYKHAAVEFYEAARTDVMIEGLLKAAKPKLEYVPLPDWSPALLAEAVEQFKRIADKDRALIERATVNGVLDMTALEYYAVAETEFNDHDCDSYGIVCPFRPLCDSDPLYRIGLLHEGYQIIPQDY